MAVGGTKIAKLFVELGFKDEDFKRGIKGASGDLEKFGGKIKSFGKMIDKAVVGGFKAAATGALAFGTSVVLTGAKFQQSMATVSAISGTTGKDFDALKDKARSLGATTTFSATQAADAMQHLARAGLTTNEIIGASGPALAFAGAMGADMAQATSMLASTMSQFGLGASESTRIVDTFTAAINSSLLDISKLQEAMKYAGTAGSAFGLSVEQTTAAVAMFANIGLEGSQAGMNFRMAMIASGKATAKKEKIMKKLGMTMADINPAMNTFEEIMKKVGAAGMSSTEAIEIFGARSGANVFKISQDITNSTSAWTDLNEAIAQSGGQTAATYETMTNTVQGQFTILKSAFQEVQLALFEGMQEGLSDLLSAWIEVFQLVGAVFADASSGISQGWNATMHGMADSVRENKVAIAGDVIEMIEAFSTLGHSIKTVAGWARNLAKIMAIIFVARKVYILAEVIMAVLVPSFTVATAGAAALSATINSMTFGLPLLAAGLAAGVTALWAWGGGMSEAEYAAQKLQDRMELLAEADKRYRDGLIENIEASAEAQNNWLHQLELELGMGGELSNVVKREFDALRGMSAEALADAVATGEAIRMTLAGGEEVTITTALATRLAAQDQGEANNLWMEQLENLTKMKNQALRDAQIDAESQKQLLADLKGGKADIDKPKVTEHQMGRMRLGEGEKEAYRETNKMHAEYSRAIMETSAKVLLAEAALKQVTEAQEGWAENVKKTQEQLEREKQTLENLAKEQDAQKRKQNWKALIKEREQAARATIRLQQQVSDSLKKALGEEEKLSADQHIRKLAEIEKAFDKEAKLYRGSRTKLAEIEAAKGVTILQANRAFWSQYTTDATEAAAAASDSVEMEGENEIDAMKRQQAEQLAELETGNQRMLAVTKKGSDERLAGEAAVGRSRKALLEGQGKQLKDLQVRLNKDALDKILQDTIALQGAQISEWENLKREEAEAIAQATEDGLQTEQEIREFYLEKRKKLTQDVNDEVLQLLDASAFAVVQLERERDALLVRMVKNTGTERAQVIKKYEELIRSEMSGTSKSVEKDTQKLNAFIRAMSAAALADLRAAFKGLGTEAKKLGPALSKALSSIGKKTGATALMVSLMKELGDGFDTFGKKVKDSGAGKVFTRMTASVSKFVGQAQYVIGTGWESVANSKIGKALGGAFSGGIEAAGRLGKLASGIGKAYVVGAAIAYKAIKGIAAAVGFVSDAVGGISGAFGKVMDSVAMLTGFTFSLSDAVGSVNDKMDERAALEAKLASGTLSASESADAQTQLANLPATAADAGASFVQDMISGSIQMVQNFVASAPAILQELVAGIPGLIAAIAEALPGIAAALGEAIPAIVQSVADALPVVLEALANSAESIVSGIVEAIPMVITAIGNALPMIIGMLGNAVVQLIAAVPEIVGALLAALPGIITALVASLSDIIVAFVAMIPELIQSIVAALPALMVSLIDGVLVLIEVILAQWPTLIAAVLDAIPVLLSAILDALPSVIMSIVDALPGLVEALVDNLPKVMIAFVKMVPNIIIAIVAALPEIVKALVLELAPALVIAAIDMAVGFAKAIAQFFKDVMTEIAGFIKHPFNAKKRPKTETFGDTPGVQKAGAGAMVGFKAGDFFAAAQKPEDLLMQAVQAFSETRPAAPGGGGGGSGSMLEGLGSALMAAAASMQTLAAGGGMGGAGDLRVTVTAEGRTLDDVLYVGKQRGHTPQLTREIRRTSGAHVGFDRGRYSPSS
jgi:TP901 family phage tail tape measure protein